MLCTGLLCLSLTLWKEEGSAAGTSSSLGRRASALGCWPVPMHWFFLYQRQLICPLRTLWDKTKGRLWRLPFFVGRLLSAVFSEMSVNQFVWIQKRGRNLPAPKGAAKA
jgi:hypothetical protein